MHEVLVNRLGGLSLPRKSVVRLTDRPDMTLDVYRGRKTTNQQQQSHLETASAHCRSLMLFIFVQLLKREPALLNAHQVPIAICSCMAIKKPRVSKRKSSETFTRKKPSHPKPVPCMPVLYNIIQSGFKLEVKR